MVVFVEVLVEVVFEVVVFMTPEVVGGPSVVVVVVGRLYPGGKVTR